MRRFLERRPIGGWKGACVSHGDLQGVSDIGLIRGAHQIKAEGLSRRMEQGANLTMGYFSRYAGGELVIKVAAVV